MLRLTWGYKSDPYDKVSVFCESEEAVFRLWFRLTKPVVNEDGTEPFDITVTDWDGISYDIRKGLPLQPMERYGMDSAKSDIPADANAR